MIRDVRVAPTPADFNVISEPGMFTGWSVTIVVDDTPHSMAIDRSDTPREIAIELRLLANEVER